MKKTAYIFMAIPALCMLGSCDGHKDYDRYVAQLQAQPAVIDTISTPQSYADYIVRFQAMTDSFASLGIKLNPTQTDEIGKLNMEIASHAQARYEALTTAAAAPVDTVVTTDTKAD